MATLNGDEPRRISEIKTSFMVCFEEVNSNLRPGSCSGRWAALFKNAFNEAYQRAVKSILSENRNL